MILIRIGENQVSVSKLMEVTLLSSIQYNLAKVSTQYGSTCFQQFGVDTVTSRSRRPVLFN